MNIPAAHRAQIFARYIGQKVQVRKKNDYNNPYLVGDSCEVSLKSNHGDWVMVWFEDVHKCTNSNWNTVYSNAHTFFFAEDRASVLVKQLSKISNTEADFLVKLSDKDAVDIYVAGGTIYWQYEFVGEMFDNSLDLTSISNIILNISQVHYLQCLGYALQQTVTDETGKPITYTVDQLVEAGVYKLLEE